MYLYLIPDKKIVVTTPNQGTIPCGGVLIPYVAQCVKLEKTV